MEIGRGSLKGGFEQALQLGGVGAVVRHAFGAGYEHIGQGFVAVDVEKEIDAGFVHFLAHIINFRAFLHARLQPFAVEIGAARIGAQVAQRRAVGVHVRNNVEGGQIQQRARRRVLVVEQSGEQPFRKPFGHALARMLAGDNPHFQIAVHAVADGQQIDVAPFGRAAQIADLAQAAALRFAQQVQMLLVGIGFEIGVINAVGQRRVLDHKLAVFIAGGHAEPVLAVVRSHRLIAVPALRIGRFAGIVEADAAGRIGRALQAEVKPLFEVGGIVRPQRQTDIVRLRAVANHHRTGIESGTDFHGIGRKWRKAAL